MAYQSMDRPRYARLRLRYVLGAIEVYSWPLVRAATGFFFCRMGCRSYWVWGGDMSKTIGGLREQGAELQRYDYGPITSGPWSSSVGAADCWPISATGRGIVRRFHVSGGLPRSYADRLVLDQAGHGSASYLLLMCLAILIRGGGPLSLDSRLGREI